MLQCVDEGGREITLIPIEVVPAKAFFWLGIVTLAFLLSILNLKRAW